MEGFIALFALGSFLYWGVGIVWVGLMFWALETEKPVGSGLLFIIYLLFLQFVAKVDYFSQIIHHPVKCFIYILAYIAIGIAWTFVKWWLFVHKKAEPLQDRKKSFIMRQVQEYNTKIRRTIHNPDSALLLDESLIFLNLNENMKNLPKEIKEAWRDEVAYYIPAAKDHKGTITLWMMYWPLSAIWSLINDFIKRFFRAIVTHLQKLYQSIADSVFKNV